MCVVYHNSYELVWYKVGSLAKGILRLLSSDFPSTR